MAMGKAESRGDGYRELFLRIPEPVFVLEAHTLNILDCNDAACRILSCRRDELIGTDFLRFHGQNDRENAGQTLRDILFHATYKASISGHHRSNIPVEIESTVTEWQGIDARIVVVRETQSMVEALPAEIELLRRAEHELRSSEERNRQLVENASDIIYAHDLEGNFTSVSSAAEQITGFSAAEALHMNIGQVVAPEHLELAKETTRRKVQGLPVQSPYELEIVTRDGRRIPLEVNTTLIYRDGQPVGVQGIARDITDRKLAEQAVRESESRFRAVAETAASAIFIYKDEIFRYVNPASEKITGYSTGELEGMKFWDLVHPEHREMVQSRGTLRQRGEQLPPRYEFKILTKSGEERWLDFTAGIIDYDGGRAVLGTAFDVTERKRVEEELLVQKAYLEELFQCAPEGIVVLNNEGRVLRANREFLRMFGFEFDEVRASYIDDLIVPEDRQQEATELTGFLSEGKPFSIESMRRRKNGTLIDVSILGTPINVSRGQIGRYVIYRDITETKRAERYRETQFATTRILSVSTTLEEAILDLLTAICHGLGWDFARMWQTDQAAGVLRLETSWSNEAGGDTADFGGENVLAKGVAVAGTVWQNGEPTWVTDLSTDEHMAHGALAAEGLRSCFAFPVRYGGDIGGVMEFFSRTLRYPDFELLDVVSDIGAQVGQFIDRKWAEFALIESESKFRAVADTAASAIYIHAGGKFLYVNRASQLISGYSGEELLKMEVWQLAHPEFRELMQGRAEDRRTGKTNGVPDRYEFKIITKTGQTRWLDFSAAVIQFEGQSAILATAFDITERKRGEQLQSALFRIANLAGEAEDLQQFYASIHLVVGELMYAKNFYIAVLDERGDMIHIPYFVDEEDLVPPPPQQRTRGLTDYVLRTGEPLLANPAKFEELVAQGEVESRGAPSIDWLGVPLKVGDRTFGVLTVQSYSDTTRFGQEELEILTFVSRQVASAIEHRRNQEALRKSEVRYRSQVQSATYGIYRSSVDGRFLDVNPALVEMLGYDRADELLALDMARDLYADKGERERIMAQLDPTARVEGVETRWKRKDGKVINVRLSGRGGLRYQGEPMSFEMICEDITERRMLEEQLRHSQKMEAVGRLAGGVAHDFNNLLTVIKGYSDLMMNEIESADPMYSEVEEIRKAADRAAQLTRQLLAFSRRQVLAPKVLDLNAIITNMDKLLRRLLGEDVELVTSLDAKLGHVKADPGQIEQVIMNLAVNARDAMPEGGSLMVETTNMEIGESYSRDHVMVKPGSYAMFSVKDTGTGMDEETLTRIFEPFFTTKEMGKGTGLGLSTVYGIVKQSGGYIWCDSEPGHGATFKVLLPIVEEPTPVTGVRPTQTASYRGTETILLVEDEDGVRALIREVLTRHGYHVIDTRHGGEALIACEQTKGKIHLLLTDVVLAQVSGRELAKRLMPLRPDMKVLYISGYTEEAIINQGVLDQGTAFLQKPFTPGVLARKVREVLTGETLA
jgi:two-component system, cell cycle sensor histidine kinase and response regulator CckA